MKIISAVLTLLFTLAVTGPAFAFDSVNETNAQVYFAIPFGGPTKAQATPRFGISMDYGLQRTSFDGAPIPYRPKNFDLQLNINGDAAVYTNGINLGERLNALYASDSDDLVEGWLIPLSLIGVGIGIFAVAKSVN